MASKAVESFPDAAKLVKKTSSLEGGGLRAHACIENTGLWMKRFDASDVSLGA
jgi:hypothetical protein